MSDFETACQTLTGLDPYKRVNYVNGLVLGVDEFTQEQLYHLEKHRLHNRTLHGYGTVCGLPVSQRDTAQGPEIVVGAGIAVNPRGQEIRVPEAHCALLNSWLQRNRARVEDLLGSPPVASPAVPLSLYLVLCYRECKTDRVPIPGGPCKSLEDSSAPSRIADAFELALRLEPPDQTEDQRVQELIELLCAIPIEDAPGGLDQTDIENRVRGLIDAGSPPVSSSPEPSHMHPDDAAMLISAAWRVWVTEVRPQLLGEGRNCASGPPDEDCVLLAEVRFDVAALSGGGFAVAGEVVIDESQRPYLLHGRLLQEWLLCLTRHGHPPPIGDHGALPGLDHDDHPQYLLADGSRALSGDLSAGGNRITALEEAVTDGDAVRFEQAVKVGDPAGSNDEGDLSGSYPNPLVQGLQNRQVAGTAPQNNQVLTWNSGANRWEPQAPQTAAGNFVQIPAIGVSYFIIAAGMFDGRGNILGQPFNRLQARPDAGDFLLIFPGYRPPPAPQVQPLDEVVYIVKGTCIDRPDPGIPNVFQFVRFEPEGIRVRVRSVQGQPVNAGFVVEISAYGDSSPG